MSDYVTVACKIPTGLRLQLCVPREVEEPVLGGGVRKSKQFFPTGEMVTINGPAVPFGQAPKCTIVGGYALTEVDADFWEQWLAANKEHDAVKAKLLFAYESPEKTRGEANELKAVRSNLEPLDMRIVTDPDGVQRPADPRLPKSKLLTIQTADVK